MAGGGKESGRQKMINLMYVVLIAMLAMNVSSEVLNAFKTVRDGLVESTGNVEEAIDKVKKGLEKNMQIDPGKTKPVLDKANEVDRLSKELNTLIDTAYAHLVRESGGLKAKGEAGEDDLVMRDNIDIAPRLFTDSTSSEFPQYGKQLRNKIIATRKAYLAILGKDSTKVNIPLRVVDGINAEGKLKPWEVNMFYGIPTTAAATILVKIKADVLNSEAEILKYLQSSIYADDFKFDKLSAVVVAPSSYVLVGSKYEAEVFLTATSTSMTPDVYVGGSKLPVDASTGKAKFTTVPSSVGKKDWSGEIQVKKPSGEIEKHKFQASYEVAAPSAAVSADKMNVLYIGVDNPISISAAGIPASRINASISGGSLKKLSDGKYIATVDKPGEVSISVSANVDGKVMSMGVQKYRVKQVPPPTPKFANKTSGKVPMSMIKANKMVLAMLDNFDFDLKFTVIEYTMMIAGKGKDPIVEPNVKGNQLTPRLTQAFNSLKPNDRIIIEEIKVRDPKGNTRTLETGVALTVAP